MFLVGAFFVTGVFYFWGYKVNTDEIYPAKAMSPERLSKELYKSDAVVVDVRTGVQHYSGHILGSVHIPEEELKYISFPFSRSRNIILVGHDSEPVRYVKQFRDAGYTVAYLSGGYKAYRTSQKDLYPTVPSPDFAWGSYDLVWKDNQLEFVPG